MPLTTDAVMKVCVDNNSKCSLSNKCEVCRKEIKDIAELDRIVFWQFTPPSDKKQVQSSKE